ncbi:MAG: aminotransferase class IV [Janthinobacterium lividum]
MLLHNGHLLPTTALPLPNRGLTFGDGFFETLIVADGRLRYATDHLARMQQAAAALYLVLPAALASVEALETALLSLAEANGLPAARVRLSFWRGGGGLYLPETEAAEWLATAVPFEPTSAPLQRVDFAQETYSVYSPLSFCKGPQAWLYVRAAHERVRRGLDELILCDAAGHVAETGAAAIFWVRGGELFTPALTSGCVAGVRRAQVLRAAQAAGVPCHEGLFLPAELLAAEAVFTANVAAVRVVQQVGTVQFSPALLPWLQNC